jgi:hypothetical protein
VGIESRVGVGVEVTVGVDTPADAVGRGASCWGTVATSSRAVYRRVRPPAKAFANTGLRGPEARRILGTTEDAMSSGFRLLVLAAISVAGCDNARKQECEKFLGTIKPLDEGTPNADTVERVQRDLGAITFQDVPLGVYAKNYGARLTVLDNTVKLKASGSAPDGTDDVIKQSLKAARTDREDIARYCAK